MGQGGGMVDERWQALAMAQEGVLTRAQLRGFGWNSDMVRHRVRTGRWVAHTSRVIGTMTGAPSRSQLMWIGVLHAGRDAIVGDLTAADVACLRGWHRDDVTVLVPRSAELGQPIDGVRFIETRRPLRHYSDPHTVLPTCRLEPAILRFGAYQRSPRTAQGVIAAAVQQRLTTPDRLLSWVDRMQPLRWAKLFTTALDEIAGGAQSGAELDVRRMCRAAGLSLPRRQTRRRDAAGRLRFTDCEWVLADGRTLVLEVDGSFHMQADQWEDDLARQRALTALDRPIIRCSARELREEPESIARDLLYLGVPKAA